MKIRKKLLCSLFLLFGSLIIISHAVANPPSAEEVEGYMHIVVRQHHERMSHQRNLKEKLEKVDDFLNAHRWGCSLLCNSTECLLGVNKIEKNNLTRQLSSVREKVEKHKDCDDAMIGFQRTLYQLRLQQTGLYSLMQAHGPLTMDRKGNCIVPGCNPHNYSYLSGRLPCQLFQHQQRAQEIARKITAILEQVRPYMPTKHIR